MPNIVLADGLDRYNGIGTNTGLQAKWLVTTTSGSALVAGRLGGQALSVTAVSASDRRWSRTLPAAYASAGIGLAIRATSYSTTTAGGFVWLMNGSTFMVGLTYTPTGQIVAGRYTAASTSTVLGTSAAGVILPNVYHWISFDCTVSDTVGVINVYVDGNLVLALTNVDTRNGAPTTIDTVAIGYAGVGASGILELDDVVCTDGLGQIAERKVETLYPSADVAQGFARSTGSANFSLVDEPQVNGDTDYVQGSVVGDVDTYDFGNLSGLPTSIDAVQISSFAQKTDVAARSIALQLKSGASTTDGANFGLTTAAYTSQERLLLTDPNTGIAWTAAAVNALRGGPKVTV